MMLLGLVKIEPELPAAPVEPPAGGEPRRPTPRPARPWRTVLVVVLAVGAALLAMSLGWILGVTQPGDPARDRLSQKYIVTENLLRREALAILRFHHEDASATGVRLYRPSTDPFAVPTAPIRFVALAIDGGVGYAAVSAGANGRIDAVGDEAPRLYTIDELRAARLDDLIGFAVIEDAGAESALPGTAGEPLGAGLLNSVRVFTVGSWGEP